MVKCGVEQKNDRDCNRSAEVEAFGLRKQGSEQMVG